MTPFLFSPRWFWFGHLGLLLLRVGVGVVFLYHGMPILVGGKESWTALAAEIQPIAPQAVLVTWAFAVGAVEVVCGVLLFLGLYARLAALLLLFEMTIVFGYFLSTAPGELLTLFSLKDVLLFLALILMGPGVYSVDQVLFNRKVKRSPPLPELEEINAN